jgi:hypothetical protein
MPITPFLNGEKFDSETTRVMGVALEMACLALRTGDCADDVKQAILALLRGRTSRSNTAGSADNMIVYLLLRRLQ